MITVRIVVATVLMAALARGVWVVLDSLLGRSVPAELVAVGFAVAAACVFYGKVVLTMRIPEARQIEALVLQRLQRA